jgi:signal transduction histidine kinase
MGESFPLDPSTAGPGEPAQYQRRLELVARLLRCYQKALGHELPNQLVAIQGLLRILGLEERARLSAEGQDYLDRMGVLARRAHELSRALAELARVMLEPPPAAPVALPEVVQEAAAEIHLLCPGLRIEYDFPQGGPLLTVPREALRQVLLQLLHSAVRNVPADRPARIRVGLRRIDGGAAFWIADNGRGLSPQEQQLLFEPFCPRESSASGNGLGLFLVRHLVESWEGAVCVESEPGRGSTFTITVPNPRPHPGRPLSTADQGPQS